MMHTKEDEKESVEQNLVWSPHRIDKINIRLKALQIAADVFAQLETNTLGGVNGFRASVDAVFKAAGLEKVNWGE